LLTAIISRVWAHIHVATVREIHLLELLTRMPWLTSLIKNVAIQITWHAAFRDADSWKSRETAIRGEPPEYFFTDRQAVQDRLGKAEYVSLLPPNERRYYTRGPDGNGFHAIIKNADDAIKS
jgi:hypothetical protein